MHEKIAALTSAQAMELVLCPISMTVWMVNNGVPETRESRRALWDRAEEAMDAPPPPGDVRRRDTERLRRRQVEELRASAPRRRAG